MKFHAKRRKDMNTKNKKVIMGACIGVVILIAIIVTIIVVKKINSTINLNDFVVAEAEGYNGRGYVSITVDWDALEEKYGDILEYTKDGQSDLSGAYFGKALGLEPIELLKEGVTIEEDKEKNLSNGDKVSYSWKLDSGVEDLLKCKLKYSDDVYTVSGLKDIEKFDAFEHLKVNFSGVSGSVTASFQYGGEGLSATDFYCEKTMNLKNGDEITVKLNEDKVNTCAESIGKIPSSMEKKYTVENMPVYMTQPSELSDEALESLKSCANEKFKENHTEEFKNEGEILKKVEYAGNYIAVLKNSGEFPIAQANNYVYLVYKVTVHNKSKELKYNKTNTFYTYFKFTDVALTTDGSVADDISCEETNDKVYITEDGMKNGWVFSDGWSYNGYAKLSDLEEEVKDYVSDNYNLQENITK